MAKGNNKKKFYLTVLDKNHRFAGFIQDKELIDLRQLAKDNGYIPYGEIFKS